MYKINGMQLICFVLCGLIFSSFSYSANSASSPHLLVWKRQYGDMTIHQHLGDLQQQRVKPSKGCRVLGCGIDIIARIKKPTADQRLAELQALYSIARGRSSFVGHGYIDPLAIGKRSGASSVESSTEQEDSRLLRRIATVLSETE